MMDDLLPFERLWQELDNLQELLKEGPEVSKSDEFLVEICRACDEIYKASLSLTAEDVDAEFTDEGKKDDDED